MSEQVKAARGPPTSFYAVFPDVEHRIDDVIADDDRVAIRLRITGTNTESLLGNPISGNPLRSVLALMTKVVCT